MIINSKNFFPDINCVQTKNNFDLPQISIQQIT